MTDFAPRRSITILTSAVEGAGAAFQPDTTDMAFQAGLKGTGALTGIVLIEVTNDKTDADSWMLFATINLSGTTTAFNGTRRLENSFTWVRARIPTGGITGTGAIMTVSMGE